MQLQMTAVNQHLASQATRLSAIDGQPAFTQFGMPGFGGVQALPASSASVISEVSAALDSVSFTPSTSVPLAATGPPGAAPRTHPPPGGVPINHIVFPHSPSPQPVFPSVGMPYFVAPTSHLSTRPPAVPPTAETDGVAVPRYHKLTFATYDGTCDPLGWLNKCEQFFRGQNTREVEKTWLASYHLQHVALQWYMVLEADMGRPTWPDFRRMCQQRFGPALSTNHLAELTRLPFGGSVDKYMAAFQA